MAETKSGQELLKEWKTSAAPESRPRQGSRPEPAFTWERMAGIAARANAGFAVETRESMADLLFDRQPLIVSDPALLALCLDVLRRCGATALLRQG